MVEGMPRRKADFQRRLCARAASSATTFRRATGCGWDGRFFGIFSAIYGREASWGGMPLPQYLAAQQWVQRLHDKKRRRGDSSGDGSEFMI